MQKPPSTDPCQLDIVQHGDVSEVPDHNDHDVDDCRNDCNDDDDDGNDIV